MHIEEVRVRLRHQQQVVGEEQHEGEDQGHLWHQVVVEVASEERQSAWTSKWLSMNAEG